jgi:hypothetical protein
VNARERFLALMDFAPVDRTLMWEFGYWSATVRRWYTEGLPCCAGVPQSLGDGQTTVGEDVRDFFGMDPHMQEMPINVYLSPPFEEQVLEDHGDWILTLDTRGVVSRQRKDRVGIPHFVRGPVANRDDWEQIKAERLSPTLEGRLPEDWPQGREALRRRDYPLCIGGDVGFFGMPRYLMGVEPLLLAYYDQPDLIRDIVSYLADFYVALFDQVLNQVDADFALFWEDMAYKTGPLISPAMFREFMLPAYQKVTALLRDHGIRHIIVDTDGNCWSLIPLFVEGGITGMYPFEANAGMDVVEVRKAFPRLQIVGGIDKMQLIAGPAAIDAELDYKIPPLLRAGGYVPTVDHNVPPDVSWDNFVYYRRRLNDIIKDVGG